MTNNPPAAGLRVQGWCRIGIFGSKKSWRIAFRYPC